MIRYQSTTTQPGPTHAPSAILYLLAPSCLQGSGFNYNDGGGGGSHDGGGGGGFGSQNSPNNRPRKSYDEQTLIPVTIRMIMNSQPSINGDGTYALSDGRELHQVKLIGAVRSADDSSTATTYQIEDGTGLIEVKEWMNDDCAALAELRQQAMQESVYVCVIGQLKEYDNKKHIIGNSVRKIESGNELTHHFLEAVYSAEKHKQGDRIVGAPQQGFGAPAGVGFGGGPVGKNAMGGGIGIGGPAASGANDLQQIVLQYVREQGGKLMSLLCVCFAV